MDPTMSPFSQLWTKIWHLQIPPKVRIFVGRALRGFLPTADNLQSHMVVISPIFPVRSAEREPVQHLFLRCPQVMECWMLTPLSPHGRFETMMAWFNKILCSCSQEMASLAGMLWTNRNNIVWRNIGWNAGHILAIAGSSLKQWKDAQQMLNPSAPNTSHSTENVTRWIKAKWLVG